MSAFIGVKSLCEYIPMSSLYGQVSKYLTQNFMTFFSQADRGKEFIHYDLYPVITSEFNSLQTPLIPSPFAPHIPPNTPLPCSNHGIFQFKPSCLWELLLLKSLKKERPVNSPCEAPPVFCVISVSLISVAARQTLCCVFYCPRPSGSCVSAPRPAHWGEGEREAINLASCTCQQ